MKQRLLLTAAMLLLTPLAVAAQQAGRPRKVATKPATPCNARDFAAASDTGQAWLCNPSTLIWDPVNSPAYRTSQKAETASADANVLTVSPGATVGTFRVCTAISVASATSGVISWTLSYTDSNGNAQSNIAQPIFQAGTAAPNTTFTTSAAGNYHGCSIIDVNNANANIIVKWVGGGTTSAKMSAVVERLN